MTKEYLFEILDKEIEYQKELISDAHYGLLCYKENGSGWDEQTRDKMIQEANEKINTIINYKEQQPTR